MIWLLVLFGSALLFCVVWFWQRRPKRPRAATLENVLPGIPLRHQQALPPGRYHIDNLLEDKCACDGLLVERRRWQISLQEGVKSLVTLTTLFYCKSCHHRSFVLTHLTGTGRSNSLGRKNH